jgi:hypothetical protein
MMALPVSACWSTVVTVCLCTSILEADSAARVMWGNTRPRRAPLRELGVLAGMRDGVMGLHCKRSEEREDKTPFTPRIDELQYMLLRVRVTIPQVVSISTLYY